MKEMKAFSLRSVAGQLELRAGSVLAACVLLMGVTAAKANTITLYDTLNGYSYGPGNGNYAGELTAYTTPSFLGNGYVASTEQLLPAGGSITAGTYGFETFCAQPGVAFTAGTPYTFTTSTTLSLGAAWLYQQFATGVLSGYNYSSSGSPSRNTDAGNLQYALWLLMGYTTGLPSGWPPPGYTMATDPFYQAAITEFGSLSGADAPNSGTYPTELLVLTDASGNPIQDQFALTEPTTVPDAASTLTLLGAALAALGFAGRKLRSK
jgi:hypothetical protein